MPGINDAFKKHCAESSDAGSILPDWRQEAETPERTDESPPGVVPVLRDSFSAPAIGDSLRIPPLWGVDLALILISVIALAAIALHLEEVLTVFALCLYRLLDAAIWIALPLLLLFLLLRVLWRRR